MPLINTTTLHFGPLVPTNALLDAPLVKLVWAAATVGVSSTAPSIGSRSMLELCWRVSLVEATLAQKADRWRRSDGYNRLDGSEKTAVSYFHGMTMAQFACAEVLGVPSLVHLDRVLALLGKKTWRSRPDFLGVNPLHSGQSVAVEAKGRSNGLDQDAFKKAKTQSKLLPTITGVVATTTVATMSYFEKELGSSKVPVWHCRMEDPPRQRTKEQISRLALIALHYQPLLAAFGADEGEQRGAFQRYELPTLDAWIWLPSAVVEVGAPLRYGTGSLSTAETIGGEIEEQLRAMEEAEPMDERTDVDVDKVANGEFHLGGNGVGLELGDSWAERMPPSDA